MKAVLYARVSSKEQEKEGFSIPAQQKLLREYARKNGFAVVQEFTDVETAKAAGRGEFGKMVQFLQSNREVKVLLVEKTDRLYRNFRDYILLEDLDIEIHLVKENEIISKDSRSHAKFIHGIKVLMAKNYIDNLSEEVKKGMREKAEHGEWPQKAPFGYRNNKTTHLVEPDPVKEPWVKTMFERYATGAVSLKKLRDQLCAEGLTTDKGRPLYKSMVELILKNPFYYGDFVWCGKLYRGIHQPLVSWSLFGRVQEVLSSKGRPRQRKHDFLFKGMLKCHKCGCSIVGEIKKGRYIYYHCTGSRGKCDQPWIREEVLDSQVVEMLKAIEIDSEVADWIVEALRSSHEQEIEFRETELKKLKRRSDGLQQRLDKAYEDRLDGIIDDGYWGDISSTWRSEQDRILERITRFKDANRDYVETGIRIIELAQKAHSLYLNQNAREKRKLLDTLLSNCNLEGASLYPTYKKPFDLIAEGVKTQEKLPWPGSNQRPAD